MTTRVARWSAPVGEHSVSERPRLTVSRPERARRRSTVDVTNGFGGHALPVLASGYLSRPVRSAGGPLRSSSSSSSPPVRRVGVGGGRAPASDGESTGGRRASAAPRVSVGVVRRRPCEVQRVARARLDRPRSGWRASCCLSAARRAAARASFFSFRSSPVLVRFRMREGRASDRVVVFVRQTDKHSWRWITGFVRR